MNTVLEPRVAESDDAMIAALSNYDAHANGLPPFMEAVLVLRVEGRIETQAFRVHHSLEPFNHAHPWPVYRRKGAILWVGEQAMRLNLIQLRVFDALDALAAAADRVEERLRAWMAFAEALHVQGRHHVVVLGDLPRLRIHSVAAFPPHAMTRDASGVLTPVQDSPGARWAMEADRVYYIHA